jgi:hypothetical protein
MTHRATQRRRPAIDEAPRMHVVQSDTSARTSGSFATLLERATQEILAVTYWFDPAPHLKPYPVTIRFSGHRVDVKGRLQACDRFVQDETIEDVVPGIGPISITARIRNINPGLTRCNTVVHIECCVVHLIHRHLLHSHWYHHELVSHLSSICDNKVVRHSGSKGGQRRIDLGVRESNLHCLRP